MLGHLRSTLPAIILAAGLCACGHTATTPQAYPTAVPVYTIAPAAGASPLPPADHTPTLPATLPPAVVLPQSGVTVICSQNAFRLPLTVSDSTVGAASRIVAAGDDLYLLADGGLYRIARLTADAGMPRLEPVLVPGDRVAGRVVQELADIATDPTSDLIYTLDKVGHVYRYAPGTGRMVLSYRAVPDPDVDLAPQVVALTVDGQGRPILLDTVQGVLWTPSGVETLEAIGGAAALTRGVAIAATEDGRFHALLNDGSVIEIGGPAGLRRVDSGDGRGLGLSIRTSHHLGVEVIYVVDALRREVIGLLPSDGQVISRHVLAFSDAGLLRDVAFAGGRLYALAGSDLIVFPGAAETGPADCPPPASGYTPHATLYGRDVIGELRGWVYPITGGTLPVWARVYPGASRVYRLGVHQGLDIFHWNAPDGFGIGWPVVAVADGYVARATLNYREMTGEEFDRLVSSTAAGGQTDPDTLQRLSGRQVVIDHGNGLISVYSHLDEIAPGMGIGATVRAGQQIGTVGVSGTQGEARPGAAAPHLHVEIWIDGRYLGQGITVPETMWWFEQIFGEPDS